MRFSQRIWNEIQITNPICGCRGGLRPGSRFSASGTSSPATTPLDDWTNNPNQINSIDNFHHVLRLTIKFIIKATNHLIFWLTHLNFRPLSPRREASWILQLPAPPINDFLIALFLFNVLSYNRLFWRSPNSTVAIMYSPNVGFSVGPLSFSVSRWLRRWFSWWSFIGGLGFRIVSPCHGNFVLTLSLACLFYVD